MQHKSPGHQYVCKALALPNMTELAPSFLCGNGNNDFVLRRGFANPRWHRCRRQPALEQRVMRSHLGVKRRADARDHLQAHLLEGVHHLCIQSLRQRTTMIECDSCGPY